MHNQTAFARNFLVSQSFSLLGSWIQQIAFLTHFHSLDSSASSIALFFCAFQLPLICLVGFAGRTADRLGKRRVWIGSQAAHLITVLTLIVLYATGNLGWGVSFAVNFTMGVITAFDTGARQAFVLESMQTDRGDAPADKSVALDTMALNISRIGGPLLSGPVLLVGGPILCFAANAFTFAVVLLTIRGKKDACRVPGTHAGCGPSPSPAWQSLRVMQMLVGFITLPLVHQFAAWNSSTLHGNATTLGWLYAAGGVGGLCVNAWLGRQSQVAVRQAAIRLGPVLIALAYAAVALAQNVWAALPGLVLMGAATALTSSSIHALANWAAPPAHRAQSHARIHRSYLGCAFVGSFAAGFVAERYGHQVVWIAGAVAGILLALTAHLTLHRWGSVARGG